MQHILALSRSAVIVRHWFEIDLEDASMEHGARIELRELAPQPHRGSESAAQVITADRPLWRADLFDRLTDAPGSFGVAHYHPEFPATNPAPATGIRISPPIPGAGCMIKSPAWARGRAGRPGSDWSPRTPMN